MSTLVVEVDERDMTYRWRVEGQDDWAGGGAARLNVDAMRKPRLCCSGCRAKRATLRT
jgi:hypothetical protein